MRTSNTNALKIRINVGGRFHADELAKALSRGGHRVSLHTSLPKSRFGGLEKRIEIHSHMGAEILLRLGGHLGFGDFADHVKMRSLGRALRTWESRDPSDVVISWSSFALEAFREKLPARKILLRDSSHISFQYQLLQFEYERLGLPYPRRDFCEARELEEYELADEIWVLSDFARRSFVARGVDEHKLSVLRLGVDTKSFEKRPPQSPGLPLRAVFFGTLGVRKGVHYLLEATKEFSPKQLRLDLIGPVEKGFDRVLSRYDHYTYHRPMSHAALGSFLKKCDLFLFPTLEDGFGQTLPQAMAVGLVPVTTPHCGAGECVKDGKNGFIVPAGQVSALMEVLFRLTENPERLCGMVPNSEPYTWKKYHERVEQLIHQSERRPVSLSGKTAAPASVSSW